MSEAELQAAVIALAQVLGYRVAHFRPALSAKGYRTPVAADGAGWPDLVLVGHGRCLFVELKSEHGTCSAAQIDWAEALTAAGQDVFLWRPGHWLNGEIEQILRQKAEPPPVGSKAPAAAILRDG